VTALRDDFQRDGAVCIRGAFWAEEAALVERVRRSAGD
jgi:hypothetical protein